MDIPAADTHINILPRDRPLCAPHYPLPAAHARARTDTHGHAHTHTQSAAAHLCSMMGCTMYMSRRGSGGHMPLLLPSEALRSWKTEVVMLPLLWCVVLSALPAGPRDADDGGVPPPPPLRLRAGMQRARWRGVRPVWQRG